MRYFPKDRIDNHLRITIGTDKEMKTGGIPEGISAEINIKEVLWKYWYSGFQTISHSLSLRRSCVHHFHDPDPGASRRSSGSLSAEDLSGKSTADLYRGKHYPDSVYPAFYPADL